MTEHLALSVRQPWAWAIISGGKTIENRSWTTPYRGPLLIHAGKAFDPDDVEYIEAEHGLCRRCHGISHRVLNASRERPLVPGESE